MELLIHFVGLQPFHLGQEQVIDQYKAWIDITFVTLFGLNIAFNVFAMARQVKELLLKVTQHQVINSGERLTITVITLLTVTLTRMSCQFLNLQCVLCSHFIRLYSTRQSHPQDCTCIFYIMTMIYFEFPYHLFNIVAYIVIMQWVQLWAILITQRALDESSFSQEEPESRESGFKFPKQRVAEKGWIWSIIVKVSEGSSFTQWLIFGVTAVLISILIIDSVFCAVDQVHQTVALETVFFIFTYVLMVFGLALLAGYTVFYILIYREFRILPESIQKTVSFKVYDKPVDNNYLIAIYLQEIIFNFVVFYNLVLKQGHEEKHFEKEYKRATTRVNMRGRRSISGDMESEGSIKQVIQIC